MFYNDSIRWHSGYAIDAPCSLNTDYTIIAESWQLTVNWNVYTWWTLSIDSSFPIYLFSVSYDLGGRALWQYKLYYDIINTSNGNDLII